MKLKQLKSFLRQKFDDVVWVRGFPVVINDETLYLCLYKSCGIDLLKDDNTDIGSNFKANLKTTKGDFAINISGANQQFQVNSGEDFFKELAIGLYKKYSFDRHYPSAQQSLSLEYDNKTSLLKWQKEAIRNYAGSVPLISEEDIAPPAKRMRQEEASAAQSEEAVVALAAKNADKQPRAQEVSTSSVGKLVAATNEQYK